MGVLSAADFRYRRARAREFSYKVVLDNYSSISFNLGSGLSEELKYKNSIAHWDLLQSHLQNRAAFTGIYQDICLSVVHADRAGHILLVESVKAGFYHAAFEYWDDAMAGLAFAEELA